VRLPSATAHAEPNRIGSANSRTSASREPQGKARIRSPYHFGRHALVRLGRVAGGEPADGVAVDVELILEDSASPPHSTTSHSGASMFAPRLPICKASILPSRTSRDPRAGGARIRR